MEQPNEGLIRTGDEEFWQEHVLKAQGFEGTNRKYCRSHNLNHRIFSFHKRRLGFGKSRKSKKAFVELSPEPPPPTDVKVSKKIVEPKKLPDPKWVASFVSFLMTSIEK